MDTVDYRRVVQCLDSTIPQTRKNPNFRHRPTWTMLRHYHAVVRKVLAPMIFCIVRDNTALFGVVNVLLTVNHESVRASPARALQWNSSYLTASEERSNFTYKNLNFSVAPSRYLLGQKSEQTGRMGGFPSTRAELPGCSAEDNPRNWGSSNYGVGDPRVICIHFDYVLPSTCQDRDSQKC